MQEKPYKYKITIAYDGTNYAGWQIQPNALTIQEVLETTFQRFLVEPIRVIGAGRTDAGVHALEQIAHFTTSKEVDFQKFLFAVGGLLPKDIRILGIEKVPITFQAQYSAKGKIYHYHLWLDPIQNPFLRLYRTYVPMKIDKELMKAAALEFIGKRNFASFANVSAESAASRDPIRHLRRLDVIEQEGGVRLEFEADGFLYKMVRNITGLLIEVSRGKVAIEEIPLIFAAENRKKSGISAPPQGLFLVKVLY